MLTPDSESSDFTQELPIMVEKALTLHQAGDLESAELLFHEILLLDPSHFTALHQLGVIQNQKGAFPIALGTFEAALGRRPKSAIAHFNIGVTLWNLKRPEEALAHYQYAWTLNPKYSEALLNCAVVLRHLHRQEEALQQLEKLETLRENDPEVLLNLGIVLQELQRPREALAKYDQALSIDPKNAHVHSCKIFLMDFIPEFSFLEHQQERKNYFRAQASDIPIGEGSFPNSREPSRPLVLGYVSADFQQHSAALCFGPILRRHNKRDFKIICYSGVLEEDDQTTQFKELADLWRPGAHLSDEELAAQIRADQVDILIDLSGHSMGNRLLVFARKPAPIQVTAWGHGGGTGLPMMDYQFTDPVFTPAWARPLFAETSVDLPSCITFEAPQHAPPIGDSPASSKGYVTFGCLARLVKVTPAALDLWANLLSAVPGSHLLLKDAAFDEETTRSSMAEFFSHRGISSNRIEMRGQSSHFDQLSTYNDVDIVLDSFPQNGGITTWEALWMGAPVITLLGNKPPSRISAAILTALGLGAWVGQDVAQYLELCISAASDLDTLISFRGGIRERIKSSPAGNLELYTKSVENAYRAMWNKWVSK